MAERQGRLDVDRMAAEISSPQLTEWMAHERLEPSIGDRIDINAAVIQWREFGAEGSQPDQFRLKYGRQKTETNAERLARIGAAFKVRAEADALRSKAQGG